MTDRPKTSSRFADPSLLLAIPATAALLRGHLSARHAKGMLHRYTTEYAVEYYVIVAMFMWGMIDVLLKLAAFPKELWALRQDWIPPRTGRVPIIQAAELLEQVQSRTFPIDPFPNRTTPDPCLDLCRREPVRRRTSGSPEVLGGTG